MRHVLAMAQYGTVLLLLAACADKPSAAPREVEPSSYALPYSGNGDVSTLAEQIQRCWATRSVTSDMTIAVRLKIGRDGRVQESEIVNQGPEQQDPRYAEAAESVLRAVRYPACQPFQLRADLYDAWKDITIGFKIPKRSGS